MMKDFDEIFTNYDQVLAAVDLVINKDVEPITDDEVEEYLSLPSTTTDEEVEMLFLIDSDGRGESQF